MIKVLTDNHIEYVHSVHENEKGVPIVWVIDGDCLYDIPTYKIYADMFMSINEVLDVSSEYLDHNGMTVRLIRDGEVQYDLKTTEYFGSILLSNPIALNLLDYQYGRYVMSPNAKFDGEKFILTDRDMTDLMPWHPSHPRAEENF